MLGTLLRLVLGLFGIKISGRSTHTSPTQTINAFFGRTKRPWLWGSILSGSVIAIALAVLFWSKRGSITHGYVTISYLLIASLWAWVGPVLIWWYETKTLETLRIGAPQIVRDPNDLAEIEQLANRPVMNGLRNLGFMFIWIGLVVYAYVSAFEFARGFGIRDYGDVWWWLILCGIVVYAYYTGLGFLFAFKTVDIVRLLARKQLYLNPYHEDGTGGLGFVGSFAATTSLMFWSGVLFLPLLLRVGLNQADHYDLKTFAVVVIYTIFILLPFAYPVWVVHSKIVSSKNELAAPFRAELVRFLQRASLADGLTDGTFIVQSAAVRDVMNINDWPFNLKNAVQLLVSILSPPAYLGIRLWLG